MPSFSFIRTGVFCSFLVLMIAGCDQDSLYTTSFIDVASKRTKLIDGIESDQSTEKTKRRFPKWEVVEKSSLSPGDKRPLFSIEVVAINEYSHLGHSGTLHLKFFNDRLKPQLLREQPAFSSLSASTPPPAFAPRQSG